MAEPPKKRGFWSQFANPTPEEAAANQRAYLDKQRGLLDQEIAAQRATIRRGLAQATRGWVAPTVIRSYESTERGEGLFAAEAEILQEFDYQPAMQSAEGSHLHAGRLLLTAGFSVFAGRAGIRSQGKLSITFQKRDASPKLTAPPPQMDIPDQLRKLAELRDAGILTEAEFDAKKAELLGRM